MRYGYMIVQVIDLAAYPSFPCHYFSDKKTFKIILVVEVSLTTFPTKIVFNLQIVRYSPLIRTRVNRCRALQDSPFRSHQLLSLALSGRSH